MAAICIERSKVEPVPLGKIARKKRSYFMMMTSLTPSSVLGSRFRRGVWWLTCVRSENFPMS
eukprot:1992295-Amphidinium_carterae.4